MYKKFNLGYDIGALVMKSWVPKPCGHISNASNYRFPVLYAVVEKSSTTTIHGGSKDIIPQIIKCEKNLEAHGCKSIFSSCGYFGHFQKDIVSNSTVPVYLSAVCLVPIIFQMLKKDDKLGIICYNKTKFNESLFNGCGVKPDLQHRCVIYDVVNEPALCDIIKDQGHYNIDQGKESLVNVAKRMCSENPEINVILLECTDLPPHSHAIQEELKIPVFDSTTMINFIHSLMWNEIHYNNFEQSLPQILNVSITGK